MLRSGVGESRHVASEAAGDQAARRAMERAESEQADCVFVFATPDHRERLHELNRAIVAATRARHLIGCSGLGVLSTHGEIEMKSAVVVHVVEAPRLSIASFLASLRPVESARAPVVVTDMRTLREEMQPLPPEAVCILLTDIFSAAPARILREIEPDTHHLAILGAAASGWPRSGETYQWTASREDGVTIERHGVAGVTLFGNLRCHFGVAQSCQPIGAPYVISKCEHNIIYEIARRPAAEVLREELIAALGEENITHAIGNVFVGIALDEDKHPLERGDFLVRNMTGLDAETGAISVAERCHAGQTIQFQLRRRAAAAQGMRQMVESLWERTRACPPQFGLYFNCLGRGKQLFGIPNHDLGLIKEYFGELPLTGLFGNAELAPIGGRNFAHNYTGVLALFSEGSPG